MTEKPGSAMAPGQMTQVGAGRAGSGSPRLSPEPRSVRRSVGGGVGAGEASAHVCSGILGFGCSRVCPEPLAA